MVNKLTDPGDVITDENATDMHWLVLDILTEMIGLESKDYYGNYVRKKAEREHEAFNN